MTRSYSVLPRIQTDEVKFAHQVLKMAKHLSFPITGHPQKQILSTHARCLSGFTGRARNPNSSLQNRQRRPSSPCQSSQLSLPSSQRSLAHIRSDHPREFWPSTASPTFFSPSGYYSNGDGKPPDERIVRLGKSMCLR